MICFDEAVALVARGRAAARRARACRSPRRTAGCSPRRSWRRSTRRPRDVSAMDGYAVRDADLAGLPARLGRRRVLRRQRLRRRRCEPGTCVRIFTGAPVPAGADRVVIQEVVRARRRRRDRSPSRPAPRATSAGAAPISRPATCCSRPGRRLDPRALVAAAAADLAEVEVWRRPRLLVLGTGDELAEPGQARRPRRRDPRERLARRRGARRGMGRPRSSAAPARATISPALEQAAGEALDAADLVVVTGGASVGEKDFAKAMFEPHGLDLIFSKVAIKPGKPVWLGRAGGRLVLGLPGNPTSAMVTARLLLAPLARRPRRPRPARRSRWRRFRSPTPLAACGDRETFRPGRGDGDAARSRSPTRIRAPRRRWPTPTCWSAAARTAPRRGRGGRRRSRSSTSRPSSACRTLRRRSASPRRSTRTRPSALQQPRLAAGRPTPSQVPSSAPAATAATRTAARPAARAPRPDCRQAGQRVDEDEAGRDAGRPCAASSQPNRMISGLRKMPPPVPVSPASRPSAGAGGQGDGEGGRRAARARRAASAARTGATAAAQSSSADQRPVDIRAGAGCRRR